MRVAPLAAILLPVYSPFQLTCSSFTVGLETQGGRVAGSRLRANLTIFNVH